MEIEVINRGPVWILSLVDLKHHTKLDIKLYEQLQIYRPPTHLIN